MDLFDLIKKLFDKSSKWDSIKPYDKTKNFFMVNRFMSINFPMQANMFNNRNAQLSSAMDSWRDVLNRLFTKPPSWIYTKTKKSEKKSNKNHPEKVTVNEWMKMNKMSKKDMESLMQLMGEDVTKEMMNFEKILNEKNNG